MHVLKTNNDKNNFCFKHMEQLRRLDRELYSPGVDKLFIAARRRGIDVTKEQVQAFAATRHAIEPLKLPQRFLGKSAAEGPNARWQVDLAEMPVALGKRFFILAVDVFTRMAYTQATANKSGPEIVRAFRAILARANARPGILTTDAGMEFRATFDAMCNEEGIIHRTKRVGDANAIAVVDRAMSSIKLDLRKGRQLQRGQWPTLLPGVTRAYNERYHSTVHDAPKDVATNPDVHFMVLQDNAEKLKHNNDLEEKRAMRVAAAGWYRPMKPLGNRYKRRIGELRYDQAVKLHGMRAGVLFDARGREELLKQVLPVRRPNA